MTYTGHDFCISTNFAAPSYILFDKQPEKTYSVHIKWSWELIGDNFKSIKEAQEAIRKFCEEHNA